MSKASIKLRSQTHYNFTCKSRELVKTELNSMHVKVHTIHKFSISQI